jgi:hypothetical protein
LRRALSDDDLERAGHEVATFDNAEILPQLRGVLGDTAQRHVSRSERALHWHIHDNVELGRVNGAIGIAREIFRIADDASLILTQPATHLIARAAAQNDRHIR